MNPGEYQRRAVALERSSEGFDAPPVVERLIHAQVGLAGEAGEFAALVKSAAVRGELVDAVNVLEEIGDVVWYATLALEACGLSLADAMEANLRKLERRREHGKDKAVERKMLEEYVPPSKHLQ